MGDITTPAPVLLIAAAFSRHQVALDWCRTKTAAVWGPIALQSPRFSFTETAYYEPSMGPGIYKEFWAFENLADPVCLAEVKIQTNAWEAEYANNQAHEESRPVNLDPGYITPAKLVLASTKDHAHRMYLSHGIYAEVTLSYKSRHWQQHPWTFPDYQRADYQQFFDECRNMLLGRLREKRS